MKDNWYDFEKLSGKPYKEYTPPSEKFPWSNPKNAYMWGAIHSMVFMTVVLTIIMLACL